MEIRTSIQTGSLCQEDFEKVRKAMYDLADILYLAYRECSDPEFLDQGHIVEVRQNGTLDHLLVEFWVRVLVREKGRPEQMRDGCIISAEFNEEDEFQGFVVDSRRAGPREIFEKIFPNYFQVVA